MAHKKTTKKISKKPTRTAISRSRKTSDQSTKVLGIFFFTFGLALLIRDRMGFQAGDAWPVIFVILGAYFLWYKKN